MTLNAPMPSSSLIIFVDSITSSPFPFSYGLLIRTFIPFTSSSMPTIVEVGEARLTTSSSTSYIVFVIMDVFYLKLKDFGFWCDGYMD